jgi:hypothetical protein
LSNRTFYQLCSNTGTLTAFTQATTAPAGTLTNVTSGLYPLETADRIAFSKTDGLLYSAPNTGALASTVLLSGKSNLGSDPYPIGSWVLVPDTVNELTLISKADGSVIDEPLFRCNAAYGSFIDKTNTHLWTPNAYCGTYDIRALHAPVANLP